MQRSELTLAESLLIKKSLTKMLEEASDEGSYKTIADIIKVKKKMFEDIYIDKLDLLRQHLMSINYVQQQLDDIHSNITIEIDGTRHDLVLQPELYNALIDFLNETS